MQKAAWQKPGSADQAPELSIKKECKHNCRDKQHEGSHRKSYRPFSLGSFSFFANAYLYLLAINFSPNPVADCINPISKRCAQSIQYHIIHIKAANFCDQLDHFYRQTDNKSG